MNEPTPCRSDDQARSPVHASRLPIFPPTRRPVHGTWDFDTPWGAGTVSGRLGQIHRDILDAARMVAERRVVDPTGALHLLVDSAKLRAVLGWDKVTYLQIEDRLEDMRIAKVTTRVKATGWRLNEGIVAGYATSEAAAPERGGKVEHLLKRGSQARQGTLVGGAMWRISFSHSWSKLTLEDHQFLYPLREVMALRHGVSQALARFCLSHIWVNEGLPSVLEKIGANGRMRERVAEINADAGALHCLGIDVRDGMVRHGERAAGASTTP